ncbi:MAG: methylated-DNA--[protein]-cysteine S-methyltransferase [Bacteroidetes bacterium]|nr:methylated-DNA--[protein]-cysteine S-methyltransferase [Bacteroidota bacterium]
MQERYYCYFLSPLGDLEIIYDDIFIYAILFCKEGYQHKEVGKKNLVLELTVSQLKKYFEGALKEFDLPLKMECSAFQERVWQQLCKIPFAKTISYLQLARQLGDEKCIRAAASANGKNPFSIVIPCHRVIGTDGSLTGYAGELWRKQWLLDHEARTVGEYARLF